MRKIIILILLIIVVFSACKIKEDIPQGGSKWGYAVYKGDYEGIKMQEIENIFPGGMYTYVGYFSTYDDVNSVTLGDQYVVNVMHKNMGLIQLICPTGGSLFYINDIVNNSFFLKVEKKYFNKKDYFKITPFTPEFDM